MSIGAWPVWGEDIVPSGRPFVAAPGSVRVVDGDTLALRGGPREKGRRIRLRSVGAPERAPSVSLQDNLMNRALAAQGLRRDAGARWQAAAPGERAKTFLGALVRDRCVLIDPSGEDRYGRITADVYVSGGSGEAFVEPGARSVAHVMLQAGMATRFSRRVRGERVLEPLPPEYPFGPPRMETAGPDPDDPSPGF